MQTSVRLSEADLALVEALQVCPRATWSAVAKATDTSPVTVSRRWSRLVDSGAAWVTGTPGLSVWNQQCVAYVAIRCSPGHKLSVADTLAGDPHALSVELTAGDVDLFVTVAAADLRALSRYLLERVDLIAGVTDTRTRICTHLYRDGSRWRLGSLPQQAVDRLAPAPGTTSPHAQTVRSATSRPEDHRILVQLGLDGRASFTALAAGAGVSEGTVRRRLRSLLAAGTVVLRAEVAAHLTDWQVAVILSIDVPSDRLASAALAMSRLRHVRLCATLTGSPAIVVSVWLRDVESVHDFETTLAKAIPGVTVSDRLVTLHTVKRMGRLLDEDGRAVGVVPMDVWADPRATPRDRADGLTYP
jgi:DNA-binding Lrp family transcriptional regulator